MLKIRLQGTTKDIKWFLKMLKKDSRFVMNEPSDFYDNRGTKKFKRVYTEIFRNEEELEGYTENDHNESRYYGSGMVLSSLEHHKRK